jgi:hypothetical protein
MPTTFNIFFVFFSSRKLIDAIYNFTFLLFIFHENFPYAPFKWIGEIGKWNEGNFHDFVHFLEDLNKKFRTGKCLWPWRHRHYFAKIKKKLENTEKIPRKKLSPFNSIFPCDMKLLVEISA